MNSGLYKIVNRVNGKFYINSSDDILHRFNRHILDLSKNRPTNYKNIQKVQQFNIGRVYSNEHKWNMSIGRSNNKTILT